MENNARYLEVAWAAQRSGLYYTAINSHLRAGRGPVHPRRLRRGRARRVRDAWPRSWRRWTCLGYQSGSPAAGSSPGFDGYEEVLAAGDPSARGRVRRPRDAVLVGHDRAARRACARRCPRTASATRPRRRCSSRQGIAATVSRTGSVYLSPAPLYHAAPLVWSMSMQRLGAHRRGDGAVRPEQCLELIERYRVTHAQFVPTMFVRMLRLPPEERDALRPVEPPASSCTPPRPARSR